MGDLLSYLIVSCSCSCISFTSGVVVNDSTLTIGTTSTHFADSCLLKQSKILFSFNVLGSILINVWK